MHRVGAVPEPFLKFPTICVFGCPLSEATALRCLTWPSLHLRNGPLPQRDVGFLMYVSKSTKMVESRICNDEAIFYDMVLLV